MARTCHCPACHAFHIVAGDGMALYVLAKCRDITGDRCIVVSACSTAPTGRRQGLSWRRSPRERPQHPLNTPTRHRAARGVRCGGKFLCQAAELLTDAGFGKGGRRVRWYFSGTIYFSFASMVSALCHWRLNEYLAEFAFGPQTDVGGEIDGFYAGSYPLCIYFCRLSAVVVIVAAARYVPFAILTPPETVFFAQRVIIGRANRLASETRFINRTARTSWFFYSIATRCCHHAPLFSSWPD